MGDSNLIRSVQKRGENYKRKLNLGCGAAYIKGGVNLDFNKGIKAGLLQN